ncbi:MAG: mechanosensitive ion channel [Prevotellaceae bacterium]|nr:mechanosensitive ion channel [Prevotellaceae bacterium]
MVNVDLTIWMNELLKYIGIKPNMADSLDRIVILVLIALVAILADVVCRFLLVGVIGHIVRRTENKWDDLLLDHKLLNRLALIVPAVIIYVLVPLAFTDETSWLVWTRRCCAVYIVGVVVRFLSGVIDLLSEISNMTQKFRNHSLKGVFQILQVLLYFVGLIIVVSIIIGRSPATLLAGLGASAAILMLVFKDTIVGFVSGMQLSANNMLKVGDWITAPKSNANGVVIDVSLNTVKVRNFDNTIITIPPYNLVSDSFQNWRGMQESGGRRVMRSINIDMNSVRFCSQEMLDKYRKIHLLASYIDETEQRLKTYNEQQSLDDSVLVNGLRQTNLGVFRAYLERYIASLPTTNTKMLHMVRQLQPDEKGIPIELYFFSYEKKWEDYERVICDVFDHVLAIVPEFDLYVYQNPSGRDIRNFEHFLKRSESSMQ